MSFWLSCAPWQRRSNADPRREYNRLLYESAWSAIRCSGSVSKALVTSLHSRSMRARSSTRNALRAWS